MNTSDIFDKDGNKDLSKQRQYLEEVLYEKYGISSEEELDQAIEQEKQRLSRESA